jgi:hypothetical protein
MPPSTGQSHNERKNVNQNLQTIHQEVDALELI